MSRSDTEVDIINTNRPRYQLGTNVIFVHNPYTGETAIGRIAKSRQIIHGHGRGGIHITYDIMAAGMVFPNVPEESIASSYNSSRAK